jgi:hypothetical protein
VVWEFAGTCVDGDPLTLNGISIWDAKWHRVPGRMAEVRDPSYAQAFRFPVYRVRQRGRSLTFAAGEFSACMWGFFVTRRSQPRRTPRCS